MTDARANDPHIIRYAVVGAGNIAQVAVLPAFQHARENSALAAIVSSDPEKRKELCERYGVEHASGYDDLEGVLEDADIDAVYIALPNALHREYVERCAQAGVHVLCEKPMAMTSGDCEAMIDACDAAGVKLMIAYRLHFEETNLRAIESVKSGAIGEPRYFSSVFSHDVKPGIRTDADAGGGALYDLGIYQVNAARYLYGAEPVLVFGWREMSNAGVDDTTSALLRFSDGRVASFVCSQKAANMSELHIVGTRGDVSLEPAFDYTEALTLYTTVDGRTSKESFKKRDQFAPELVTFSRCILDDTEPEASGVEGLADIRVLEAIVRADENGKAVELPPFEKSVRPSMAQEMEKPAVKEPPEPVNAPSPSR